MRLIVALFTVGMTTLMMAHGALAGSSAPTGGACNAAIAGIAGAAGGAGGACGVVWDAQADLGRKGTETCDDGGDGLAGLSMGEPVRRVCVMAADLDGDGMLDVACTAIESTPKTPTCAIVWDSRSQVWSALRGACEMGAPAGISIDEPGVHRVCVLAADLDGDGMLDLALAFEEGKFRFAGWTGDAACSGADGAAKEHGIQGLDAPTFCEVWNQPLGLAKQGHEMSKSIIQNIRA